MKEMASKAMRPTFWLDRCVGTTVNPNTYETQWSFIVRMPMPAEHLLNMTKEEQADYFEYVKVELEERLR